jgi:hypothetical protein
LKTFQDGERACAIWLCCDYRDEAQQTPENMIGALLRQIMSFDPDLFDKAMVQKLQKEKKHRGLLSHDLADEILEEALGKIGKSYI